MILISLVLVRLLAIYFFVFNLYQVMTILFSGAFGAGYSSFSISSVLNLVVCVILVCFPRVVLIGLAPIQSAKEEDFPTAAVFQTAGIALIGLWFLLSGLSYLVNDLMGLVMMKNVSGGYGSSTYLQERMPDIVSAGFDVVAGAFLISGSGAISRLFTWLRQVSPRTPEDADKL
ncbi:hypothetical protein FMN50_23200 [Rhodobacterales bacterium]|nr:hypothetical protein FMN50_23200 [Rhodobacterales bacterium]